jgi:hypothetical protein
LRNKNDVSPKIGPDPHFFTLAEDVPLLAIGALVASK